MIHPDVAFEHTEINQVRRFVDLSKLAQPNPRTLYILHEKGRILKAWDSAKGKVSLPGTLRPSAAEAERLRGRYQVEEVQLIDRETYQAYLKKAHDLDKARDLTGYDYREWTRRLKGTMGEGFLIHPPREHYDYYHYIERTRAFVKEKLQPDCAFLLGVFGEGEWWTSGFFLFTGGLLTTVSTFEAFQGVEAGDAASGHRHQALLKLAAEKFQKTAFGLFLPRESFEDFARKQWRGMGALPLLRAEP